MSDATGEPVPPFHLLLDTTEVPMAAHALRLLISDEAHEPDIRRLAREVIDVLDEPVDEHGLVSVALAPQQMKITHTAVRLLLNDLQREQEPERALLRAILDKLPDEHLMRAIQLD
jgi:hypothetical protein